MAGVATPSTIVEVSTGAFAQGRPLSCANTDASVTDCSSFAGSGMEYAIARAYGSAGLSSLTAGLSGGAMGAPSSSSAFARSSFSQSLIFQGTGPGILEYTLSLAGYSSGSTGNSYAWVNGQPVSVGTNPRSQTFQMSFVYGVPFEFSVTLQVGQASWLGGHGDSGLMSASATLVDTRVLGRSNDFPLGQTPEPSAAVMAATALGALGVASKLKRQRRAK